MNKMLISIFIGIILSAPAVQAQNHNPFFEGYWYGLLKFQGSELVLTFEIKNENDSLVGAMNSPLQAAYDIPITKITTTADSLYISMKSLGASFKGILIETDSVIDGFFSQSIFTMPLKFQKTADLFTLKRPQEPKPPFDYIEEEVGFHNLEANVKLSGTLTYPDTNGSFPAVILITGSGPQDRNEEILGHKPFFVISDFFTKNGIAVLRYDERGVGESSGTFATATTLDFAADADAAVAFLRQHPRVNTSGIGLLGHSEGGMVASIVASRDKNIAFIVLLAGPAIGGKDILFTQQKKIFELSNYDKKDIDFILKDSKKVYSILEKEADPKEAVPKIRKYLNKRSQKLTEEKRLALGYTKQAIEMNIMQLNTAWFRYFIAFEPESFFKNVGCPSFILFGEKDVQVTNPENIKAMQDIIKKHNKSNFTVKLYPNKNHLFQNAKTGAVSEYALIEETICEDVLRDIVVWITALQ